MISTDASGISGAPRPLDHPSASPALYPLSLRLEGRSCLVVGGGGVAARKVRPLVDARARVTVVAPRLGRELAAERSADAVPWEWLARGFEEADAGGRLLVIAATDDPGVNARVAAAARAAGALVNVVDDPDECDFFVPAVVRRGPFQIAVSTGGEAPGLAARVRARLEDAYGPEWGAAVAALGAARRRAQGAPDPAVRRELLRRLAALDAGSLLAEGGSARVAAAAEAVFVEAVK